MKKIASFISAVAFIATLSVIGFNVMPVTQAASSQSTSAKQATPDLVTSSFSIEKMTCAACPITVRKAMESVAGVDKTSIDFKNKTATVIYDPNVATIEQISGASTNAGYRATLQR